MIFKKTDSQIRKELRDQYFSCHESASDERFTSKMKSWVLLTHAESVTMQARSARKLQKYQKHCLCDYAGTERQKTADVVNVRKNIKNIIFVIVQAQHVRGIAEVDVCMRIPKVLILMSCRR